MPSPRVSVVIPVLNRRDVVLSAIDSVLGQTFRDVEVIVVDDGSTDGTADAVGSQRPGVRVLRLPENRGPAAARNAGTAVARGDLVMLLDSDDELLPDALARHVAALDADPGAVLSCSRLGYKGAKVTNLPDQPPQGDLGALLLQLLDGRFPALLSSCVIRRAALDELGGSDATLATTEDIDLFLRLAPLGRFAFLPQRLTARRLLPDRYSFKMPVGDVGWNAVLGKVLASPHGDLVRPHVRRLRASRHVRLFDRLAGQGRWREAFGELRRGVALDARAPLRLAHVRRKLLRHARKALKAWARSAFARPPP